MPRCSRDRVIKPWAKNADTYSSGVTNAAYVVMERNYAPAQQRLTALIAREKAMPGALAEARKNLANPPKIFTEIAIEQIDGNIKLLQERRSRGVQGCHRRRDCSPSSRRATTR